MSWVFSLGIGFLYDWDFEQDGIELIVGVWGCLAACCDLFGTLGWDCTDLNDELVDFCADLDEFDGDLAAYCGAATAFGIDFASCEGSFTWFEGHFEYEGAALGRHFS